MDTARVANTELVLLGYEAFNRGDIDAVLELFDPDVEVGVLDDSPIAESFHGHDGFRKLIAENNDMFDQYRTVPEEIAEPVEGKIMVVVHSAARGRLSGAEVEGRVVHLWTVGENKVTRLQVFHSREDALRAAAEA